MNIVPYPHIALKSWATVWEVSMLSPNHHWRVNDAATRSRSLSSATSAQTRELHKEMKSLSPGSPPPADPCFMLPLQSFSFSPLPTLWSVSPLWKRWISKSLFCPPSPVFFPRSPQPSMKGCGEADASSSPSSIKREEPDEDFLSSHLPLTSRRASWGSRWYWLSWWRCHQSQKGGRGSGKGQSMCQGSEREGPRAGPGGNWEAPPMMFLLLILLSQSAPSPKAGASHPRGVLVWEPAPPYQEGWSECGRSERTLQLEPQIQ